MRLVVIVLASAAFFVSCAAETTTPGHTTRDVLYDLLGRDVRAAVRRLYIIALFFTHIVVVWSMGSIPNYQYYVLYENMR